jgi:hypothetical protein
MCAGLQFRETCNSTGHKTEYDAYNVQKNLMVEKKVFNTDVHC